jgi:hypothetical protein
MLLNGSVEIDGYYNIMRKTPRAYRVCAPITLDLVKEVETYYILAQNAGEELPLSFSVCIKHTSSFTY